MQIIKLPNILVTGTPGVGKSKLCKKLEKELAGYKWHDVSKLAKDQGFVEEYDEQFECPVLNEDELLDFLEPEMENGGNIIEYHGCDFFPERWFQLVFVVRCDNTILYDRLQKRGYNETKLKSNIECEIFQTILEEAQESYDKDIIHELKCENSTDLKDSTDKIVKLIEEFFTFVSRLLVAKTPPFRRYLHKNTMDWTCKSNIVFFQQFEAENVNIYFKYSNEEFKVDRAFNFCRKMTENVDTFLDRASNNVQKELNKRGNKKQKKSVPENEVKTVPEVQIKLLENNSSLLKISIESFIERLSLDPNAYSMVILDKTYVIKRNLPWVTDIKMPSSILAGYFVYPNKLDLALGEKDDFDFVWMRGRENNWEEVGKGFSYCTKNEDIGHALKVRCIPKIDSSYEFERIANCSVQAGPGFCPFEERHLFTENRCNGNKFRVISYNILADLYTSTSEAHDIFFPYCQKYALNIDYRKQLFIKEIIGYNADIICLQEVDSKIFDLNLKPILKEFHMDGVFGEKRDVGEGEAIFFNTNRFQMLQNYKFDIGENLQSLEIFHEIHNKLKRNQQLYDRLINLSTTLTAVVLRSIDNPGQVLIVANTHLYFHPDADHIRLMQIGLCVLYLENIILEEVKLHHVEPSDKISIIFSGDFNSDPPSGIFELMTKGQIDTTYKDWNSKEDEAIKDIALSHPFKMANACGCNVTNYTKEFKECIDYIFYQTDHLAVDRIVAIPSEEQLSAYIAIPSVVFPSDHIALIADMKFEEQE